MDVIKDLLSTQYGDITVSHTQQEGYKSVSQLFEGRWIGGHKTCDLATEPVTELAAETVAESHLATTDLTEPQISTPQELPTVSLDIKETAPSPETQA